MKVQITVALLLGFIESAQAAGAQQPDSLQVNASYQCSNNMTVTVIRCAKENGKEYCEFKVEQNDKLAFQGVKLREKVAAGVKSCRTQAASSPNPSSHTMAEPGKSFNPSYLNDMPSIDFVKQEIQGKDATDTLARQVAVFTRLTSVISSFRLAANRYDLTPDEAKITGKYQLAGYELEQGYKKTHTAAEADTFLHLHGHYELMDPTFDREMRSKLFSTAFLQQLANADKRWLQALQAHKEEEKRASEQAKAAAQGSQFIRNDPGTLAARRCVELGGSELECVGKGFWTGLTDLAGMAGIDAGAIGAIKPSEPAGVVLNGAYQESGGMWLNFGTATFTLTGCGKLVPNDHSYTISKRPNQLLIDVKSEPTTFVLSMGSDGKLSGPGPVDVKGQIITGYRKVWMQHYHNNIAVAEGSYWASEPIYETKTERCTIATFVQAPPPPPEKNPFVNALTSMINTVTPQGPPGLRMLGTYASPGGLALEFSVASVVLDCGEAHVKQSYTVENAPTQFLITVKNGSSPFTMAVQPNRALVGSGSTEITGRVVTGSTKDALTYATRSAPCTIGTLTPKTGN